jgi:hypothetical protein
MEYVKCENLFRDVTRSTMLLGLEQLVSISLQTSKVSQYIYLVSTYHLLETDFHLFFPQMYHQMNGGYSEVYSHCVHMLLKTSTMNTCIVKEEHNLPIVCDSFVSGKAKKALASIMRSGLCHTRLNALDFLHDNDLGNLR